MKSTSSGRVPRAPGRLVVERVDVVVAVLGVAELVATQEHRGARREQQRGEQVARLPGPQRQDRRVGGRPLDAVVGAAVVVGAVAALLAVGLVVLALVGHEVGEGEAVVRGDEVDRRGRGAGGPVEVRGAGDPGDDPRERAVAAPEVAHVVAEPPVPLRPRGPEAAHLVALAGGVPGLGDQLDRREHRVRGDVGEQRRGRVEAAAAGSSQGRGEVEAEAVDAHRRHPVAQGVDDQAPDQRRRRRRGCCRSR